MLIDKLFIITLAPLSFSCEATISHLNITGGSDLWELRNKEHQIVWIRKTGILVVPVQCIRSLQN